jgi:hypothetical protein
MLLLPFATLQINPTGALCTDTAYAAPDAIGVAKTKLVAPTLTFKVSLAFASTRPDLVTPDAVPPSE